VVEDDALLADQLRWALKDDYSVRIAGDRPSAVDALERWRPDLILLDLCLPPRGTVEEGFAVLNAARTGDADRMAVVMSAADEREPALRAISQGAYDFFSKPVDLETLKIVIGRAMERLYLVRENRRLREELHERFRIDGIIGISPAMQRVFDAIRRVADSPITVILEGESGTGKELVARAIHFNGTRREGPFVPVHCAALPDGLLEAELFGHEKGAFTGAEASRVGRFEAADGGTLFLDEVSCLSLQTQIKLLRVLDERTVERLGSNRRRPVDIRLIVATNEEIAAKVERGEFREDLFFRINVFPIRLPALRERVEDIPLLAEHFLKRLRSQSQIGTKRFSPETLQALMARDWPGNVRELLNLVETVALLADAEVIQSSDLPGSWSKTNDRPTLASADAIGLKAAMRDFERRVLIEAIARADGVKSKAARDLGLDASQMKYLVRKHDL
jgi:two-component system NtrC family response regulator